MIPFAVRSGRTGAAFAGQLRFQAGAFIGGPSGRMAADFGSSVVWAFSWQSALQ